MKRLSKPLGFLVLGLTFLVLVGQRLEACTGLTLKAKDGAVVFGRTMEWGTFDLRSRVVIIPRGFDLQSPTPDGKKGLAWKTKYGAVGIDAVEKNYLVDGMNEKGLSVNLFYHEGFAEYPKYDPAKAAKSLDVLAVCPFLLTTCATTDEARKALADVTVVGSVVKEIGSVPPVHLMITDSSGKAFVLEFTKGVTTIHDTKLGVITNGPNYNWHVENLLNYTNLDTPLPKRKVEDLKGLKFGGGNRLFGLPGDLSSPSRFLRVASYSGTARETDDGKETMYEIFRILDNFNLSVGASAEGSGESNQKGMRSSTIWTTAYDTKNLVMQYHTMHNRRVRQLDLKKLDFDAKEIVRLPLDREKSQDIEDVTPKK
ncbi:linear amide C-N hydrolase [Urbifossiella limnaea]|uniref:Penicillin acylase n=1 Tax=Urbifossiella limnaea TaxID=2528023 RepID=A0A517Y3M4_9BACT|nr:linear amide C-N hydrolase [Urbifossiella limnaea]QDU24328.1 Penicillin acylase precursor [Urbifossiella limnaea]